MSILRAYVKFLIIWLKYRRDLRLTRQLKSSKIGKSCLIIANGPSALSLNYASLNRDKVDVIVVNGFFASEIASTINPDFYVLSDPSYNLTTSGENKIYSKRNAALTKYLLSTPTTLVCPVDMNIPSDFQVIKFCNIEHTRSSNFSDLTRPQGCLRQTALLSLVFAEHMNYDQIAIIGMDNSYIQYLECDKENRLTYDVPHIASDGRVYLDEVSGFENDTGKFLYFEHRTFLDFNYFSRKKITNLDLNSLNTAFQKKTLDEWSITK